MKTLHRYLLRELLAAIAVSVLVCTGLLLLGNLLKEILALLMSGQATLGLVIRGIGLLIPFVLAFSLPMGALAACLLVFGRLSADQELTAARANGISLWTLAVPALLLSLALCAVCAAVNMDLAPRCRVAYTRLFKELAQEKARVLIPAGRFVTHFPGFVIYAERIEGDDIEDVLFFQIKNGRKVLDVRAPRARLELRKAEGELRLTFLDGRMLQWVPQVASRSSAATNPLTEVVTNTVDGALTNASVAVDASPPGRLIPPAEAEELPGEDGPPSDFVAQPVAGAGPGEGRGEVAAVAVSRSEPAADGFWQPIAMSELPVRIALPQTALSGGLPSLSDMTFRQLLTERSELLRLGIEDVTPIEVHLHRQVAFSFASFVFALVGIPLGVRAHRRETSVGIALAIGLVLIYYAFLIAAQALATQPEAAPWMIVWLPNALFQLVGAWLLWRVNRGQ